MKDSRISNLKDKEILKGDFVLYWMQRSQRAEYNHALEHAIEKANELNLPVVVYFGLTDGFTDANLRHYKFMLEGLQETIKDLEERGIQTVVRLEDPSEGVPKLAQEAALVVVDKGYLNIMREWRENVGEKLDCSLVEVESDVVVPVEVASDKEEYAARTIRPKIQDKLDKYLQPLKHKDVDEDSIGLSFQKQDLTELGRVISKLNLEEDVKPSNRFSGGLSEAKKLLNDFIENKISKYEDLSNDPSKDYLSHLSPYLHFGQISPLYIALKVSETEKNGTEEFLEQLIIRRELAINFVHYNQNYDKLESIPEWARETLKKHEDDEREYVYTFEEFENAQTHDPYWNAAQEEMVKTGKMHGYMRMYWGKKILEWSDNPEEAYRTALKLNNKYELDGRDPNGYTGVAWCFGKHDQGWKERPVYGKVRYMSDNGLERKFDVDKYVEKVENI